MKREIALYFAILLLWTVAMSVIKLVFDQELNATNLGVIIIVGAIVVLATFLAGRIAKIRQSEIARFFAFQTHRTTQSAMMRSIARAAPRHA